MYRRDAEFLPYKDVWTRKNMIPDLVKMPTLAVAGLPNVGCCPYGTYMDVHVPGDRVRLYTDYDRFPERDLFGFQRAFVYLKGKLQETGHIFGQHLPKVAEVLRRNEWNLFLYIDNIENQKKNSQRKTADVTYHITHDYDIGGPDTGRIDLILAGNELNIKDRFMVDCEPRTSRIILNTGMPIYADALYDAFVASPGFATKFIRKAGWKEKREVSTNLVETIDSTHDFLKYLFIHKNWLIEKIDAELRTIADHPRFKELHPEMNLEALVAA